MSFGGFGGFGQNNNNQQSGSGFGGSGTGFGQTGNSTGTSRLSDRHSFLCSDHKEQVLAPPIVVVSASRTQEAVSLVATTSNKTRLLASVALVLLPLLRLQPHR